MSARSKIERTPGPYRAGECASIWAENPYGHGLMHVADMRGWGHLTGRGGCAMDQDKALAIQDATCSFVVSACNDHDALLALNAQLLSALNAADRILWMAKEYADSGGSNGPERRDYDEASAEIAAALAAARGEVKP